MPQKSLSDLSAAELDYLVAAVLEYDVVTHWQDGVLDRVYQHGADGFLRFNPSADWAQAGPLIIQQGLYLSWWGIDTEHRIYRAEKWENDDIRYERFPDWTQEDHDPLVAAMRCIVQSRFGNVVECHGAEQVLHKK